MSINQSDSESLTQPFRDVVVDAHLGAWAMWAKRLDDDPEFMKPLTKAERFAFIHRHITDAIAIRVDGDARVRVTTALQFFALVIEDTLMVRFKHLDRELRPRNYQTTQQQHLAEQEFSDKMVRRLTLDGIGTELAVVTAGYTLTVAEDAVSRVSIVCHEPERAFFYDMYSASEPLASSSVQRLAGFSPRTPRVSSKRAVARAADDLRSK